MKISKLSPKEWDYKDVPCNYEITLNREDFGENFDQIINKGEYQEDKIYNKNDYVLITKNEIKYYFISKINNNSFHPTNKEYWIQDQDTKNLESCKSRFNSNGMPFGGFPKDLSLNLK